MLGIAAILGLIFIFSQQGGAAGEVVSTDELKKLHASAPDAYALVNQALHTVMNPADMVQLALGLSTDYPGIAKTLLDRAQKAVTPVTGKSGITWNTWTPGPRVDGWIEVHVLYDFTKVIAYMQKGSDKSTRQLLGVAKLPMGLPEDLTEKAKSDFV
jgi:hypothetical protein